MKTKAAIAIEAGRALEIDMVDLEGPKDNEVLVEIKSTGVCHTDAYTLSGKDPEGIFPAILGHEGAGIVVEVGKNVKELKKDDCVIPLYTPECRTCKFCLSGKTNLCQSIRETQGKGLMPDGTSRFQYRGKTIFHYMGTSTFSNIFNAFLASNRAISCGVVTIRAPLTGIFWHKVNWISPVPGGRSITR